MDIDYMGIFNSLARQHTVLVFELDRLKQLNAQRGPAVESDYEIKLDAKIKALNKACTGLAELLEL